MGKEILTFDNIEKKKFTILRLLFFGRCRMLKKY